MIEIKDVSFSYGDNLIFENVSLSLQLGKFYGVIGQNGIGKSTLLNLISRHLDVSSGCILVDGINIKSFSRFEFAKRVSVLPQEKTKQSITVYDHIASGRYPYHGTFGRFHNGDKSIINDSAKKVGVYELFQKDIRYLSGGERQKVYIATVLAQDTPYILLDEPTTFLDISTRFEIMSLLGKISETGKSIIAVLHDISLAMKYCDKLLILNKDFGINVMTPEYACNRGIIDELFNVRCKFAEIDGKKEFIITER